MPVLRLFFTLALSHVKSPTPTVRLRENEVIYPSIQCSGTEKVEELKIKLFDVSE